MAQTVSHLFGVPTQPIYDDHLYGLDSQLSLRGPQSVSRSISDHLCDPNSQP